MLADTVADVATRVVAETVSLGLEVDGLLPAGQVGTGQIGGTTEKLRQDSLNLAEDSLGELAGRDSRVRRGVGGEALLPTLGELTLLATDEVGVLLGEALTVLGEELVPLSLEGSAVAGVLAVEVVDLLGNSEALGGVEAELLLELLNIVGLEGRTVDTVGALVEGSVTDSGAELDQRRLVSDLLGGLDGGVNGSEVVVTVVDGDDVPAVSLITLGDVLSEGNVGVTVNGDVVVVPDSNQVAELKVSSERRSFGGDTLHQATITEEAVCVVVNKVEVVLVEGGGSVSLGDGKTDGVADTLTEGTSGHLNSGGVMGLRVTGSDAVQFLRGALAPGLSENFINCPQQRGSKTYTEILEVLDGQGIAEEVQQGILQHASVTVTERKMLGVIGIWCVFCRHSRENESIAVQPLGVLGVELHVLAEENMGNRSHAHGGTGMAGVAGEGGINLDGELASRMQWRGN